MAVANKVVADFDFISPLDDKAKVKTTWKLRALTGFQWMECVASGKVDFPMAIRYGLIDWANYFDADGNEIEFNPVHFDNIPSGYLIDIYMEIEKVSTVGTEERKNS